LHRYTSRNALDANHATGQALQIRSNLSGTDWYSEILTIYGQAVASLAIKRVIVWHNLSELGPERLHSAANDNGVD